MAIPTPPYLKWREGRPRWEPGPQLRREGWCGRDLKDEHGAWLSLAGAIEAAQRLNREVAAHKAAGTEHAPARPPKPEPRTLGRLATLWQASPEHRMLAPKTRRDYAIKLDVFLVDFGRDTLVRAVTRRHLKAYWRRLFDERGHAMANGVLAVVRAMLSYAVDEEEWLPLNPAFALKLTSVAPRTVVWSPSEVQAAVDTADGLGMTALADAIVIALHTGQRQADVLALEEPRIDGGRARFRQAKTGQQVAVPFTDQLERRIRAIRARRAHLHGVVDLALARRVVLDRGKAYGSERIRKDFAVVRDIVARQLPDFRSKTFADLRDTAVTRLALAGCTVAEIRAITGHSLETVHSVLKHYLALDDAMAASAIGKLQAWMEREEIRL